MPPPRKDVTRLLNELAAGQQEVLPHLIPLVYDELRRLAASYLRRERRGHTFQPTALVHEAYLRLIDQEGVQWHNRGHFFGIAAQQMRRILLDYARAHHAAKRGGHQEQVPLDEGIAGVFPPVEDLIALDEAMSRLAALDPRQVRIVELRVFAGLTIEETADALSISETVVKRDWNVAKAWLLRELTRASDEGAG
jgi:RNA polymerase sigma factor (TIGR02999 family)